MRASVETAAGVEGKNSPRLFTRSTSLRRQVPFVELSLTAGSDFSFSAAISEPSFPLYATPHRTYSTSASSYRIVVGWCR